MNLSKGLFNQNVCLKSQFRMQVLKMEIYLKLPKLEESNYFTLFSQFKKKKIFSLLKVAFIILFNGLSSQIDEFATASDQLANEHAYLITSFYSLLDKKNAKTPINVQIYEEFLCMPKTESTRK